MKIPTTDRPNHTMIPNRHLDYIMPHLTGAQLKVLFYIDRRTFGFQKKGHAIAYSQFLNGITKKNGDILDLGCGVSKPSLVGALDFLCEVGLIEKVKDSGKTNSYSVIIDYNLNDVLRKITKGHGKKTDHVHGKKTDHVHGKKTLHTKERVTKESKQKKELHVFAKNSQKREQEKSLDLEEEQKRKLKAQRNKDIVEVIEAFETHGVALSVKKWYQNKTYREAAGQLLDKVGKDKVIERISYLNKIHSLPYIPSRAVGNNPYKLLHAWVAQQEFLVSVMDAKKNKVFKIIN